MITKHKNRYVLVEASELVDIRENSISAQISGAIALEMGQVGYLKANPKLIYQTSGNSFIVRTNRGYEKDLILALCFIKELGGKKIGLYSLSTSGTIKALLKSSTTA